MTLAVRTANPEPAALVPVDSRDQQIARLAEWAQAAQAAFGMAKTLCNTQFVPQQYKGKPEEATAAILAGAEVGLSPMAALRAFDNIQGIPAPKALTLRAIVQAHGHDIRIVESTDDRAVVHGRRRGDEEWHAPSTWDIARAARMGLTGKSEWKKQPGAMLVARATAEMCRWIASDAIMGMPYSAEELADSDGHLEDRPQARRPTVEELLTPERPPGDDGMAVEPGPSASGPQMERLFGLLNQKGYTDPYGQKEFVEARIGRQVRGRDDLSAAEADAVIRALLELPEPQVDDETGGADLDDPVVTE